MNREDHEIYFAAYNYLWHFMQFLLVKLGVPLQSNAIRYLLEEVAERGFFNYGEYDEVYSKIFKRLYFSRLALFQRLRLIFLPYMLS